MLVSRLSYLDRYRPPHCMEAVGLDRISSIVFWTFVFPTIPSISEGWSWKYPTSFALDVRL